MRRALLPFALVVAAATGLAAAPARADIGWVGGADFRVGGAYFSLGFHRPATPYYGYYEPVYYYRVRAPLRYAGVRCTSACYLRDGYYHHHPTCPVVSHHFRRYDYHPGRAWSSIGVPYRYYGHHDYRPPRPYYRWDDRRDDHRGRGWGHYKSRGRGHYKHDRHKHDRHCGHH